MASTITVPKRIQRKRTAGWTTPPNTIYVGRPTVYGNPFRVGVAFCGPTLRCLHTPAEVVDQFRAWLALDTLDARFWDRELIDAHTAMKAALRRGDLAGKNLSCWCPEGQPCHADHLLALANGGDL